MYINSLTKLSINLTQQSADAYHQDIERENKTHYTNDD